jgi:hypothetical protein
VFCRTSVSERVLSYMVFVVWEEEEKVGRGAGRGIYIGEWEAI